MPGGPIRRAESRACSPGGGGPPPPQAPHSESESAGIHDPVGAAAADSRVTGRRLEHSDDHLTVGSRYALGPGLARHWQFLSSIAGDFGI